MLVFVILHYNNIQDTIECINSIKKINNQESIKIIVVDNNTLKEEEIKLIKSKINDLILLDKNLGFAKANNIGIDLAKNKYNPEFVYCINNDTIIEQKNLIDLIKKSYKKYKFDAAGPYIITNNGDSVNPFNPYREIKQIEKVIKKNELLIKIYKNLILANLLEIYLFIKYKIISKPKLKNGDESQKNVALHGCAIIFSKKYLEKYQDAFYNETFLYCEEEFLDYRRRSDNLMFVYDKSLRIFHKEGASLNFSFKNDFKKKVFRYTEINESLRKLIKLYGGYNER